jgi:hypothetical protein
MIHQTDAMALLVAGLYACAWAWAFWKGTR